MRTAFTYCMGLAVTAAAMLACADTAKPLPELPLTVESIEAFADPGDVELLNSTSYYSKASKDYIYRNSSILEEYQALYIEEGLVAWLYPGMMVQQPLLVDPYTWSLVHEGANGAIAPTWNRDGHLVFDDFIEVTKDDVDVINNMVDLVFLKVVDTVEKPFDVSWISSELPLKAFHVHASAIENASAVCHYPELEFIRYINSGLLGDFNTADCAHTLETIFVTHSDVESLTITQLSSLGTLNLIGSSIERIRLDGESLPNLKSIFLGEASVPSDLSRVHLPEGLVQLLMPRVTDNDLSQLDLPEHLQYLDLSEAQLDDFGFILGAKNLRHLSLDFSNFTQWHLLP